MRPEAAGRAERTAWVASASHEGDPFVTYRSLLFTVAYEMLGSAADAEDVVKESWLRWADVDHAEVRDPRPAPDRHPAGAQPAAHAGAAARGVRRGVAARAAAPPLPTWPRTSSSPRASRSRC